MLLSPVYRVRGAEYNVSRKNFSTIERLTTPIAIMGAISLFLTL